VLVNLIKKKLELEELLNMKGIKKIKWKRWILSNGVVWICHSSVVEKGKTNGLCEEKNDCCDSFNEIAFQIDWLSDYTN